MNFWIRLASSIVLVILMGIVVTLGKEPLLITTLIFSLIGYVELTKSIKINKEHKKSSSLQVIGILGIFAYYVAIYYAAYAYAIFALIMTLILTMGVYVVRFPKYHSAQIMGSFFCFIYSPVMLSFLYLTRELDQGMYIVWLIFISSWISDTFAYIVGMLFGSHRLAPNLSPKKSVEGAVGGMAASALFGALYAWFIVSKVIDMNGIVWIFAMIGGIGSIVSQIGDLFASGVKRNYEIKDYGKCIPGHGGIMDRFDSLIFVAPIIFFLAVLFTV